MEQYGRVWTTHARNIPKYNFLFKNSIVPKPEKTSSILFNNLREFTNNTSLHGFRFLLNKKYTKIERFLWLVMVICSMLMCSYVIIKITVKRTQNPFTFNYADISLSDWHVPFPAVTICSETKTRQRAFNFSKAFGERWNVPPTINEKDLKIFYDLLLVCNNSEGDGPDFADRDSLETIRKLAPTHEETFMTCLWGNLSCKQMFYSSLSREGYCFTFNMQSPEEMFKTQNLHKDYYYMAGRNKSSWTMEAGYEPNAPINAFPLRSLSYSGDEFEVILLTDVRDKDIRCHGFLQGFKVWLHNPAELPSAGQPYFRLPIKYQLAVAIKVQLTTTSESLRRYDPNERQCYFADERYLSFFRTYTENNCGLECIANYTAQLCGCVPPYMPRGSKTKICGGKKQKCIIESFERVFLSNSRIIPGKKLSGGYCNCLQACTEITYITEVSQAVYDVNIFKRSSDPDIAEGWRLPSGLVLYIANAKFTSILRSELYSTVQFLSICGGTMGLFIGFSFLSLGEILFFCTLRLWHHLQKPNTFIN